MLLNGLRWAGGLDGAVDLSAIPLALVDDGAERYEHLSYDDVIQRNLQVMDTSAISLCRDHRIPLRIYDMSREGDLMRILRGEQIGTLVGNLT